MKRITTILSLIAMMLVSGITYADDINIFLRNKWDNKIENDSDTKTQVLFLADRMVGSEADPCTPTEVDFKNLEQCSGDDCYTITVSVIGGGHGKVYQADETTEIIGSGTWSAEKGIPGLFKVVPSTGHTVEYSNGCGVGSSYPNYYLTDYTHKSNCTLEISFVVGEPEQRCDARPTTDTECDDLLGTWENGVCDFDSVTDSVPKEKIACEALGGLFTGTTQYEDEIQFHNIVAAPGYSGGTVSDSQTKGACILPQGEGDGGGQVLDTLYFCDPPVFKSCTTTASKAGIDYRSVIKKVMQERPDIKYGLYALNGSGAKKVFPVDNRDSAAIETIISTKFTDAEFPAVDKDTMTTMSALSDVYDYLKSGSDGDVSPLLNKCAHTQLVVLASGGHSGDDTKHSGAFDLKDDAVVYKPGIDTTSYAGLLKGIAEYLNNDDGLDPVDATLQHNIKGSCTARVTTNVIGVNPVAESEIFTTTLGQEMATLGGGIYKNIDLTENTDEGKEELGTELFNTILSVVDHSRQDETALITPVAPVSITRGYHVDTLYAPAFKPQEGVNWPGNITIGTSGSVPTPNFTTSDISFKAIRKIYTLNDAGTAVIELIKDGDLDTDFNQEDLNWLKHLTTSDQGNPSLFGVADRQELLGDILHFRPLPIHIGDQTGGTAGEVDADELFVVVGSNRGLLHVLDMTGEEQWAFLPPQLKPMVKALRNKNIAPAYNMVNHFYGVDGAPSILIYDAGKDGKINPDEIGSIPENASDTIMLYFGLRRGGAGYFALDITDPAEKPTSAWNIGKSTLQYGESHTVAIQAVEAADPEQTANATETPVDDQPVTSGGSAGVCNEILLTQGASITAGTVSNQCHTAVPAGSVPNTNDPKCGTDSTKSCLYGTCDLVGYPGSGGYDGISTGFGPGHRVLESIAGTYIGKSSIGYPVWTSKRLCVPTIGAGETSINIKPEASMQFTTAYKAVLTNCYVQSVDQFSKTYVKGKLAVGLDTASAYPGRISSILGFNITHLAELLAPTDNSAAKIKITGATLSLGHTKYIDDIDEDNDKSSVYADKKDYGDGVNVYAAIGGAFGDHPWQEGGLGKADKDDCIDMDSIASEDGNSISINSGSPITKLLSPVAGSNRTSGGAIESELVLSELFGKSNWYVAVNKGNNYEVDETGTVTLPGGEWTQENVYIQFGLSHDTAVSWGMVRESAALANHMNLAKYPDGDYYEQVSPNLQVDWCWTTADKKDLPGGCDYLKPTGSTLKIAISGTGSSVAVQKDGSTVATCEAVNAPCTETGTDYAADDTLTLVATPGADEQFDNWLGCTVADEAKPNECSITLVNGANNVYATFAGMPYDLQVALAGLDGLPADELPSVMAFIDGSGTGRDAVSGLTGNDAVSAKLPVKLEAADVDGKVIESWSGQPDGATGCVAGSTICTFDMPAAPTTITVTYTNAESYTLTVNAGVNGTVSIDGTPCSSSPCIYTETEETTYTVTVSDVDAGYETSLSGCSGDVIGCTVTIGSSQTTATVDVTFDILQYTVTASAGEGGAATTSGTVNYGEKATITVTPTDDTYTIDSVSGANCTVTRVSGDETGATYETSAITDASCVVTAIFAEVVTGPVCTTITSAKCSIHENAGRVTCTETKSDSWYKYYGCNATDGEACTYKDSKYGFGISDDVSVQLYEDESGNIYSTEAACLTGEGGGGGGDPVEYNLTTSVTGIGSISNINPTGTSCGTNCATYAEGTEVTITASTTAGNHIATWSDCTGDGVDSTSGSCTVTMSGSNKAVGVTFEADSGGGGTLQCDGSESTTAIYTHNNAGRSYQSVSNYYAEGSNESLGTDINATPSLMEVSTGVWRVCE